jgi:hypothetical protein
LHLKRNTPHTLAIETFSLCSATQAVTLPARVKPLYGSHRI